MMTSSAWSFAKAFKCFSGLHPVEYSRVVWERLSNAKLKVGSANLACQTLPSTFERFGQFMTVVTCYIEESRRGGRCSSDGKTLSSAGEILASISQFPVYQNNQNAAQLRTYWFDEEIMLRIRYFTLPETYNGDNELIGMIAAIIPTELFSSSLSISRDNLKFFETFLQKKFKFCTISRKFVCKCVKISR